MEGIEQLTCILCFKTDNPKSPKDLFELWLADDEQITLLQKLQAFLEDKLWVNECTVLCENCIKDLNEAFHFKNRLLKSQEIWKTAFLNTVTSNLDHPKKSDEELNDITTPISNYEVGDGVEILKAPDLAKDLLFYYLCKNCEAVFINSTDFSEHKCEHNVPQDNVGILPKILHSVSEESDFKKEQPSKYTTEKKQQKLTVECDLCGKFFKDNHRKNGHKIKVHFKEKVFPCTFCSKSFKQKYHLKEHLTSHTGEKSYICAICNKKFQRISSQRRHMRSHEKAPGQKVKQTPFLCPICGKSFPFSNGVQRHMRIHTGEKKYECKLCGRKFMQSTHLHVHLRTHTGERPYNCEFCEESFALKAALQKHISNSHNIGKS